MRVAEEKKRKVAGSPTTRPISPDGHVGLRALFHAEGHDAQRPQRARRAGDRQAGGLDADVVASGPCRRGCGRPCPAWRRRSRPRRGRRRSRDRRLRHRAGVGRRPLAEPVGHDLEQSLAERRGLEDAAVEEDVRRADDGPPCSPRCRRLLGSRNAARCRVIAGVGLERQADLAEAGGAAGARVCRSMRTRGRSLRAAARATALRSRSTATVPPISLVPRPRTATGCFFGPARRAAFPSPCGRRARARRTATGRG